MALLPEKVPKGPSRNKYPYDEISGNHNLCFCVEGVGSGVGLGGVEPASRIETATIAQSSEVPSVVFIVIGDK